MKTGEKIRDMRKRKNMTQEELSGDYITRNMLSQIETGKATPSVETVSRIASALEVDISYFFSDETYDEYIVNKNIKELRRLFSRKEYRNALDFSDKYFPYFNDEAALIVAESHFHIAKSLLHNGYPEKAAVHLKNALVFCGKTMYDTSYLKAKITLLSGIAGNIQSPRLELETEVYEKESRLATDAELYHYICDDLKYDYKDSILSGITAAHTLMKSGEYEKAAKILSEIDDNRSTYNIASFLLFRICCDLEICYREIKDFELAYKYSTRRISLMSAFKL